MSTKTPKIITRLRAADNGSSDQWLADFTLGELEEAALWCVANDGNLLVPVEDELEFRLAQAREGNEARVAKLFAAVDRENAARMDLGW